MLPRLVMCVCRQMGVWANIYEALRKCSRSALESDSSRLQKLFEVFKKGSESALEVLQKCRRHFWSTFSALLEALSKALGEHFRSTS
jgi:nitrate reductase assembly molybdenum cofactor insertion protein NarJ